MTPERTLIDLLDQLAPSVDVDDAWDELDRRIRTANRRTRAKRAVLLVAGVAAAVGLTAVVASTFGERDSEGLITDSPTTTTSGPTGEYDFVPDGIPVTDEGMVPVLDTDGSVAGYASAEEVYGPPVPDGQELTLDDLVREGEAAAEDDSYPQVVDEDGTQVGHLTPQGFRPLGDETPISPPTTP